MKKYGKCPVCGVGWNLKKGKLPLHYVTPGTKENNRTTRCPGTGQPPRD